MGKIRKQDLWDNITGKYCVEAYQIYTPVDKMETPGVYGTGILHCCCSLSVGLIGLAGATAEEWRGQPSAFKDPPYQLVPNLGDNTRAQPLHKLAMPTTTGPLDAGWMPRRLNGSVVAIKTTSKNPEVPGEVRSNLPHL